MPIDDDVTVVGRKVKKGRNKFTKPIVTPKCEVTFAAALELQASSMLQIAQL